MNSQVDQRENYQISELLLHSNTLLLLKEYSVGIKRAYIAQGGVQRNHSLHCTVLSNKRVVEDGYVHRKRGSSVDWTNEILLNACDPTG